MPRLGQQLSCFAPSFHGVFPSSGSFPFHTPWPRDAFGGDRTACASRRTEDAALLYQNLCFQHVFLRMGPSVRVGMQHPLGLLLLLDPWSVCSPCQTQTCNRDSALQCSPKYLRGRVQNPCAAQTFYPSGTEQNGAPGGLGLVAGRLTSKSILQALERMDLNPSPGKGIEPGAVCIPTGQSWTERWVCKSTRSREERLRPCRRCLPHPMGMGEQQPLPKPAEESQTARHAPPGSLQPHCPLSPRFPRDLLGCGNGSGEKHRGSAAENKF